MPRKESLADVLIGRRRASEKSTAIHRRSTKDLTRQQRKRLAPRPPRKSALLYLRLVARFLDEFKSVVERELFPILPEIIDPSTALVSDPDPVDAQYKQNPVPRTDHFFCDSYPVWYKSLLKGDIALRRDALNDRFTRRFGQLEVALAERTGQRQLGPALREVAAEVARHNQSEMSRVLSVDLRGADVGLESFIGGFIEKNVRLIQSVGVEQLSRMQEVVSNATQGQTRVEELRDQILSTFDVTKSRASLIARDQTLKANAQLTQVRQQQVGVTEYIWTSSGDERVRPGHLDLDGTTQSWLVPPVVDEKTGRTAHPGEDYQCRCTATPIVDQLLS